MIKVVAIDDEPLALNLIESYSSRFNFLQFEKGFSKTKAALKFFENNIVDLLFLDINMPAISGIAFYKSLPYRPMLIFTTSYSEYALESYELAAVDYLLKPFSVERFEKAVNKANEKYKLMNKAALAEKAEYLVLKAGHSIVRISLSDILFIEGLDNYLKIYLQNQSPIIVRLTMKLLMEKLPMKRFARVHKSYIVSILHIESVKQKIVHIAGEEVPISRNYEKDFWLIFNNPAF
ncbi:LytR/AlgR family response regulator transcription factor [Parafilimonas sp.]|uniref:LytR/AlgR family response regulator transcription factor n=1 Tax=Parafilimonas sp. TaxID=1969739 RepID=UPI0039E2A2E2